MGTQTRCQTVSSFFCRDIALVRLRESARNGTCCRIIPLATTIFGTFQESASSCSTGVPRSTRLPLFVVELAYAEGMEELATSSRKSACADPSDLIVCHPSENEFHKRLEVCPSSKSERQSRMRTFQSNMSACTNLGGIKTLAVSPKKSEEVCRRARLFLAAGQPVEMIQAVC